MTSSIDAIEETLPLRAHKDTVNPPRQLDWCKDRIGDVPLIDLDGDVIGKGLLALSKGKTFRGARRGPATCKPLPVSPVGYPVGYPGRGRAQQLARCVQGRQEP